jgi:ubiquitin related modifier 1
MSALALVKVELSGGCELLFGKKTSIPLMDVVPQGYTLQHLVLLLREKYIVERPEQFVDATGTTLRPGVLALVNDCDAEVLGGMTYVLENNDTVEFVSTLHGG